MNPDFILNGAATGNVASKLLATNFDVGCLRPYVGRDGRSRITMNVGMNSDGTPKRKTIVTNAPALLRKDEWKTIDLAVKAAAQPRLKAVADLRGAGLVYNIPNGMGKTVLETETVSEITPATTSMDGVTQGDSDRPKFELTNLPLPITHKDWAYPTRQLMTGRNIGNPLDTTHAELAGREVAEAIEKLLIGTGTFAYGGGNVYGYTNWTDRATKTITTPTTSNQATTLNEVLDMIRILQITNNHYGPYDLYYSPSWSPFMNADWSVDSAITLKMRLERIEEISNVMQLDYLTNYDLVLVQKTQDVVRMVIGMDFVTVQWETDGGMMTHFKTMAIMVPQLRSDIADKAGVCHGSV